MPSTLDLAWQPGSLVAPRPVSSRGFARPPSDRLGCCSGKVMPRSLTLYRSPSVAKELVYSVSLTIDELCLVDPVNVDVV